MNSKLFNQVEGLAEAMLNAAEENEESQFYSLYAELEQLCNNEAGKKSEHPVLWETLADFTEDNNQAIQFYEAAYVIADQLKENEYKASIQFSMACRYEEMGNPVSAIEALGKAEKFASFTEDSELQEDIASLKDALS